MAPMTEASPDTASVIIGPAPLGVIEVTGADRASFLDAILSQAVATLPPGSSTSALYLDAHGNAQAVVDLAVMEQRIWLLVPDVLAEEVARTFAARTFLADAHFAPLTGHRVLRVAGGEVHATVAAAGLQVRPGHATEAGGVVAVAHERHVDLAGTPDALAAVSGALPAQPVDRAVLEGWEVRAGLPAWGHEIVPGHLPEELGLLPTHVHLAKGCYPGQEAVARMWMLGRPRRRLAVVEVDPQVAPGWTVGDGRSAVTVTRVAGEHGLAFVPATAAIGERFEDDTGVGVTVQRLVGEGRPVPGHDPKVTRRRDRHQ